MTSGVPMHQHSPGSWCPTGLWPGRRRDEAPFFLAVAQVPKAGLRLPFLISLLPACSSRPYHPGCGSEVAEIPLPPRALSPLHPALMGGGGAIPHSLQVEDALRPLGRGSDPWGPSFWAGEAVAGLPFHSERVGLEGPQGSSTGWVAWKAQKVVFSQSWAHGVSKLGPS